MDPDKVAGRQIVVVGAGMAGLVAAVQEHGKATHNISLTREQILIIARPVVIDRPDA